MASTLHNRKDVTSVRVEGFPSPDAKMMTEAIDDATSDMDRDCSCNDRRWIHLKKLQELVGDV